MVMDRLERTLQAGARIHSRRHVVGRGQFVFRFTRKVIRETFRGPRLAPDLGLMSVGFTSGLFLLVRVALNLCWSSKEMDSRIEDARFDLC